MKLDKDQKALQERHLKEIYGSLSFLKDYSSYEEESIHTGLSCLESYVEELGKLFNFESAATKRKNEIYVEIRAANNRIRELEDQIGKEANAEICAQFLKVKYQEIQRWWGNLGLGYIHDIYFYSHGIVKCIFHPNLSSSHYSDTPVTDKENLQQLAERYMAEGLICIFNNHDYRVKNCDSSRKWIYDKLEERFPGIKVSKTETLYITECKDEVLWHIETTLPLKSI